MLSFQHNTISNFFLIIFSFSIRFVCTIHTHNRTNFVRTNGQVANSFTFETQTHHIGMHSALIKINLMNKLWKCDIALVRTVCGINEWMNSNYYSWKDDEKWVIESMNRMNECTNIHQPPSTVFFYFVLNKIFHSSFWNISNPTPFYFHFI